MKKSLLWGAAAALALSLTSCDAENISTFVNAGLTGDAEIIISGQGGFYGDNDTVEFASTLCDEMDTIVTVNGEDRAYVGTLDIFANIDLSADGATLRYPFMGFQISDSATGTYTMTEVLTPERLRNFTFDSIADIVFNPSGFNVLVIAVSDTSWYVTYGGTITITEYPALAGQKMKGTFNNVQAYYFTQTDVEGVQEHLRDANFDLGTYFTKTATINGEFKSKRWPSVIKAVIDEAYNNRGLWEGDENEE